MARSSDTSPERDADRELRALDEFFMGTSKIHDAAASLGLKLDALRVPYAIAGAIALGVHGYRRATEDVDVLVTRQGLARFKERWLGRGYVELRPGGKAVRDTINDVKIDFLIAGDYPGDGKPKPVAFPEPEAGSAEGGRLRVLSLPLLVELKLASAMSAPHRGRDFFDIVDLIRREKATAELRDRLHPFVRAKFDEAVRLAAASRDDDY